MNGQPSAPFVMVFQNINSLAARLSLWSVVVDRLDAALPSTPLLYAFVESGHAAPVLGSAAPGWQCSHHPGPPGGGGGISLLYHRTCPIVPLPQHTVAFPPPAQGAATTAMVWHRVQPNGRAPFLLATVYLPPHTATKQAFMDRILSSLDTVPPLCGALPVLVVGDFNLRHEAWHQQPHVPGAPLGPASSLADWADDAYYTFHNKPDHYTRVAASVSQVGQTTSSIIDLVFSSTPALVHDFSTQCSNVAALASDHLPVTIDMRLASFAPPLPPPPSRPRVAWDQLREPEIWQMLLPFALSEALLPLQSSLRSMAADVILRPFTAQTLLDTVYAEFEQAVLETCVVIVGTRAVSARSRAWFRLPGVQDTYNLLRDAAAAYHKDTPNAALRTARLHARRLWRKVSGEAKLTDFSNLCSGIGLRDNQARWQLFKRTAASSHSPLSSIQHPTSSDLPASQEESLDNLCTAFVAAAQPPAPDDSSGAYTALRARVDGWAGLAPLHLRLPSTPAHSGDDWPFTPAMVQEQCQHQHVQSAPGPDAILPVFLRHAGEDCWAALSVLFTFSWRHGVLPLAWREANVMALWKQAGSKSSPASYRPISMTSIVARTFEHMVARRLVDLLDPQPAPAAAQPQQQPLPQPQPPNPHQQPVLPHPPAPPAAAPAAAAHRPSSFNELQFGFRKRRTQHDAIHYLISNIQRLLHVKTEDKGHPLCPVLFLDIKKAFDRVDHHILLDRLHAAGIQGRAWRWLRAFLSGRRMRTVDGSLCSGWQHIGHGVPQGCVLSPLLFLVFINPLAAAIQADSRCALVHPVFFADDAAIVPAALTRLPCNKTVKGVDSAYRLAFSAALSHLDAWCAASRMQFGDEKSKWVLFHSQRELPASSAAHYDGAFSVCGFPIRRATSYNYLGLELTGRRLSWARQTSKALTAARTASKRVLRVVQCAHEPSFATIRTLVLGYVVPSCMYGCMFWARHLSDATERAFQAKFAAPVRAALHLPTHTHQLGALVLGGVSSFKEQVILDQLRFLIRLRERAAEAGPAHPSVATVKAYTAFTLKHEPREAVVPLYALSAVTHARLITLPDLLDPSADGVLYHLAPAAQAALQLPPVPPACLRAAVNMVQTTSADRWRLHGPSVFGKHEQREIVAFSCQATARLTPATARSLGRWSTFRQWTAQHARPAPLASAAAVAASNLINAALNSVLAAANAANVAAHGVPLPAPPQQPPPRRAPHETSAPLTVCQREPGCAYFLRASVAKDSGLSYQASIRRCRILMSRSFTQHTRVRFAKSADPDLPSTPGCLFAACAAAAPPETDEHILLHCPRYTAARNSLTAALAAIGLPVSPLHPLSLSTVLCASTPPGLAKEGRRRLLSTTERFLSAVDDIRRAAGGLLPLDAG